MPGKPNRPLFELLRDPPKPGVRERADAVYAAAAAANAAATAAANVEAKPDAKPESKPDAKTDPKAESRPAAPSRIEVMKPGLAAREAEAARAPEPFLRVKMSVVYLAVAGVFAIALLVWVVAYTRGKATGAADSERKLGVLNQPAQPTGDPLNTPGDRSPETINQSTPPAPADPKKAATKPARSPAAQAPTPGSTLTALQVAAGTGDILTPAGRTTTDPRIPDFNYFALATLTEEDGADAIAFLARSGLESFAVPNKGDRRASSGRKTVVLIAARGITAEQYKKDPIKTQLETTSRNLGTAWKKQGGSVDFGQAYWQKYGR